MVVPSSLPTRNGPRYLPSALKSSICCARRHRRRDVKQNNDDYEEDTLHHISGSGETYSIASLRGDKQVVRLPSGGIVIAKLEVDKVAELINQRVVGLDREVDKDLDIYHDSKNARLVSRA